MSTNPLSPLPLDKAIEKLTKDYPHDSLNRADPLTLQSINSIFVRMTDETYQALDPTQKNIVDRLYEDIGMSSCRSHPEWVEKYQTYQSIISRHINYSVAKTERNPLEDPLLQTWAAAPKRSKEHIAYQRIKDFLKTGTPLDLSLGLSKLPSCLFTHSIFAGVDVITGNNITSLPEELNISSVYNTILYNEVCKNIESRNSSKDAVLNDPQLTAKILSYPKDTSPSPVSKRFLEAEGLLAKEQLSIWKNDPTYAPYLFKHLPKGRDQTIASLSLQEAQKIHNLILQNIEQDESLILSFNRILETLPISIRATWASQNQELPPIQKAQIMRIFLETQRELLTNRDSLALDNLGLKTIPKELALFENLSSLNLGKNQISSLHGMPHLQKLQTLDLKHNQISFLKGMPYLQNLQILILENNHISSLEGMPNLQNLQNLYLDNNQISSLKGMPNLQNLYILNLNNNQISSLDEIPSLQKLEWLYLKNNHISSLDKMPHLQNLEDLYLDNNQITSLDGMPHLQYLRILHLDNNQISSLKGMPNLRNLENLYLDNNQISSLKGMPNLQNLQILILENNYISSLAEIPSLQNLKWLYLRNNQISSLHGMPNLQNLENLYLDNNQISSLHGMPNLQNLENLYLDNNQISSLKGMPNLQNLENLYLNNNQISSLDEIPNLQKLERLYLSHNQISSLPKPNRQALEKWLYSRNSNTQFLEGLSHLKKLTHLDLTHNRFQNPYQIREIIREQNPELRKLEI
jgi:Leucine-rich repeat (LRR) protein